MVRKYLYAWGIVMMFNVVYQSLNATQNEKPTKHLSDVIGCNDIEEFRRRVASGISDDEINELSKDRDSLLHFAILDGCDIEIINYLLLRGLKVSCKNSDGATSLLYAVYKGNLEVVKLLGSQPDGEIEILGISVRSLFLQAACGGHLEIIRYLYEKNPDGLNGIDCNGKTPLDLAVLNGHIELATFLANRRCSYRADFRDFLPCNSAERYQEDMKLNSKMWDVD